MVRQLPPDSPLGIALNGDAGRWGVEAHLLATVADILAAANWQRGGGKRARPKPIRRPNARAEKRKREYAGRLRRLGLDKTRE